MPKHKGFTVLLVDMKSPGVEVRPLKQMTGESEFCEIFFRDVRVPVENVLGKVNDGWNVAVSTLMYERGSYGARLHLIFKRNIDRLIELAQTFQKNGHPAAQDPTHAPETRAMLRGNRNHALESAARVQPRSLQPAFPGPKARFRKFSGAN